MNRSIRLYLDQFDGYMIYTECEPTSNLDSRLFDDDGNPTQILVNIKDYTLALVDELTGRRPPLVSLIGSYANGTQSKGSDIDLWITMPDLSSQQRVELTRCMFEKSGATLANDGFSYEKQPDGFDFMIETTPPLGRFYNLTDGGWGSLNLYVVSF